MAGLSARLDGQVWVWSDGTRLRAICGGGGGGDEEVTMKTEVPPKTEEELTLLRKQTELLDLQLTEIKRQNEALTEVFPAQKELLKAQTDAALQQVQLFKSAIPLLEPTDTQKEIQRLSDEKALAVLQGKAPQLSPEQQANVDQIYASAEAEGQRGLRRFSEELASSRGLSLTDTPVADVAVREARNLSQGLAGAKAAATLNVGQAQQQFDESVRQFQETLKQQAYQNRLSLIGRTPGSGQPTLTTGGQPTQTFAAVSPLLGALSQERLAGATRTQTTSYNPGFFDYFSSILSSVGGAAGGYAGGSSASLKTDIVPLDRDEYAVALRRLRDTPITRWRYHWDAPDRPKRIGPILELSPDEIKEDRLRLNVLSYAGLLHAGLKDVDRRVLALETRVP